MPAAPLPRLAILGCGAIAEQYYLPALTKTPADRAALTLVDANPARLEALSPRSPEPALPAPH